MKQALLFILCVCYGAPGLLLGQNQSKLTVDFVETDRRCRDDAAVVRACNVAYGHYTVTEAPMYHTNPTTYRIVLLCQPAGQEIGRKDCIPLEAGQSYSWSSAHPDNGDWFTLYGDFNAVVAVKTSNGNATYAMKIIVPERLMSSGHMR